MDAQRDSKAPPALLIDALGTLVALEPPAPRLRAGLARQLGIEVTEPQAQRALAAEITFYRAHMGDGRDAESLRRLRRHCARVLGEALPDPAALADLDALTDALLDALRFTAFPDARDALLRARSRGVRVVVVSNWDISLLEVLERVGLAPLLQGVVTSAAVGARKPAAAIFEHALRLAGTSAGAALHVGDSLDEDVAGARACGIRAVLLRRDGRPGPEGVPTITGLDELAWP
ncbi:MAG: HAD-IA family hydrolase [Solirubrobacteraceae bacterium]